MGHSGLMTRAEAAKGIRNSPENSSRFCARSFTAATIDQKGGDAASASFGGTQ
jgi:hypothetical protein